MMLPFIFIILALSFYMAWTIGANDLSNILGTSIGSKALTLKQAIILGATLEFLGALLLGSHVAETIQGEIITYSSELQSIKPYLLAMMGSLLTTALWLHLASYFQLPVSTTHSLIGSITGAGIIMGGFTSINWSTLGMITLSWVITPIASGVFAFFSFILIQKKILFATDLLFSAAGIYYSFSDWIDYGGRDYYG